MNLVVKIIFYLVSKTKHTNVVISHWFWQRHYRGALQMNNYKISDSPLNFKLDFISKIEIAEKVDVAGSMKLLALDGGVITIGKGTFFNQGCSLNALFEIEIGENCLFGENVKIYDHNHRFNKKDELLRNQGYTKGKIKIGDKVWIGSNVVILKNVSIGDNVVVGAGCVVSKDVPGDTIVTHISNQIQFNQINYK